MIFICNYSARVGRNPNLRCLQVRSACKHLKFEGFLPTPEQLQKPSMDLKCVAELKQLVPILWEAKYNVIQQSNGSKKSNDEWYFNIYENQTDTLRHSFHDGDHNLLLCHSFLEFLIPAGWRRWSFRRHVSQP
jgi:hypothetical protein